ncbi:MAG: hypothetical protein Q4A66_09310, partial [Eubacteriales bacterium]|nr:hypothetical protein [Eubacteriales bacterium]
MNKNALRYSAWLLAALLSMLLTTGFAVTEQEVLRLLGSPASSDAALLRSDAQSSTLNGALDRAEALQEGDVSDLFAHTNEFMNRFALEGLDDTAAAESMEQQHAEAAGLNMRLQYHIDMLESSANRMYAILNDLKYGSCTPEESDWLMAELDAVYEKAQEHLAEFNAEFGSLAHDTSELLAELNAAREEL